MRAATRTTGAVASLALALLVSAPAAEASSHREAPAILGSPQVDGTDFYMFRSYEPGREGFVTLIANYNPLQDPYGGPNYFPLDTDAFYDVHVNNDGAGDGALVEDLTFRFAFTQGFRGLALPVGGEDVAVPVANLGPFGPGFGTALLNTPRSYTVRLIRGSVDAPTSVDFLVNEATGLGRFAMPYDNVGTKSIPNYEAYANAFMHDVMIPGCGMGRVFAGQRREGFAVNLGEVFDLVNLNPVGEPDVEASSTAGKNVTSLALEVPIDCLTEGNGDVIGGWTTARLPRTRSLVDDPGFDSSATSSGDFVQVSRLGNPLVNEVAIGLPDKNLFNASHPRDDGQFLTYVTNPTLPEIIEILFGVQAPTNFPRQDLIQVFLTGLEGVNDDGSVGEVLRLNTALPATPKAQQLELGVAAGDVAGYPNGRRPGDDTVDIALRAMMGLLCHLDIGCTAADAPDGLLPYTDGTLQTAAQFDDAFPYLRTPLAGSPYED